MKKKNSVRVTPGKVLTLEDVTMLDVWKKYNHSALFTLPLIDNIENFTRTEPHIGYPLLQLATDYGLINTYMQFPYWEKERDYDPDEEDAPRYLHFLFDSVQVQKNLDLTTTDYYSFSEFLIDHPLFEAVNLVDNGKKVVYTMEIPHKFYDDLDNVMAGKYSKTSKVYKEHLRVTYDTVPSDSHVVALFVTSNNLPYCVVNKLPNIKRHMEKVIKMDLESTQEYYSPFNSEKETLEYELQPIIDDELLDDELLDGVRVTNI